MNRVELIGRLARDPELRYTSGKDPLAVTRFTLAVDRAGKSDEADFIQVTVFGGTAEFVEKYFVKGLRVGVAGRIQTALRGTWPTMPANAFGDAPALVGEFWSLCTTDGFEIFMYLGCFCLACSVAAWVLFKGRG